MGDERVKRLVCAEEIEEEEEEEAEEEEEEEEEEDEEEDAESALVTHPPTPIALNAAHMAVAEGE